MTSASPAASGPAINIIATVSSGMRLTRLAFYFDDLLEKYPRIGMESDIPTRNLSNHKNFFTNSKGSVSEILNRSSGLNRLN